MNSQEAREFLREYSQAAAADPKSALEKYVRDDALLEHAHFFLSAFPGYTIEPLEVVADENKIAAYMMLRGTHGGPLMGLEPTGKQVESPFMIMYFVEDRKIVKHHIVINEMDLLGQLGVLPAAAAHS